MASDTSVGTFDALNATGMGDTLAALPEESRRAVLQRGLIIGVTQELSPLIISPAYKPAVAFALMVAILIIRPTGLFKEAS